MARTVGDFLIERLYQWGVRRIYGYPGDGINGVLGALNRAGGSRIGFVQVRHEEMAAFMACADAKFTGELGVCLSSGGPGAIHLATGLYDAKLDHMPVLAIAGQVPRSARGARYPQELNLERMFADVAEYVQEAADPAQVRHLVDIGIRIALARRGVSVLVLPSDLQEQAYHDPPRRHGSARSGIGYARPVVLPQQADLLRAGELLNAGERPAILVGAGALGAADEVIQVANKLGAGVAKALLGKAVLPDDLPWVTGAIGYLGTEPSYNMMMACDTLLMVGTGFPYSEFLPQEGQARAVQIDIDASMLSIRYPAEVNLHGDARATLRALLPLIEQRPRQAWRERIEEEVRRWWQATEARAFARAKPVNPQRVAWELSPRLPDHAIVTCDSGSCASWYARDVRIRRGQYGSLSGNLSSMGAAVPYAIAAKFAHPTRAVIALVGDGAMQMNGMAELVTVAKYWRQWHNPVWIACVFNNGELNQVTWDQRVLQGDPMFEASRRIPNVPYHKFGELIGLRGIYCDDPDKVGLAWAQAFAAEQPVVLEFKTDPSVPQLPPHISLAQAKNFVAAAMKGNPEEAGVLAGVVRQMLSGILPGERK